MKEPDRLLGRLLRAAAASEADTPEPEMPFGFDTRVLALAREHRAPDAISILAQRAGFISLAIIGLAMCGLYASTASENEVTAAYAMADSVIARNLTP
ncbi:MAG: hypothetical protein ABI839_01370 [Verrucomicrobiota bacterium]